MKVCIGLLFILFFWVGTPVIYSNAFLETPTYVTVSVKTGENVWGIAAHYVTEKEDIRKLVMAIREINGLNANARVYPGQSLKIPVLTAAQK